jgi:hypothetical protein
VNSFLSMIDLNTNLNGTLPHAYHHDVYRCRRRQGPREKEPPWCMEEGRRRREEEEKEEEEEEGGTGRPAQRPVRPGHRPDRPAQSLVRPGHRPGAPRHRTGSQPDGICEVSGLRPVDRTSDRTTRSTARSDRPQTGSVGFDSTTCTFSTQVALYAYIRPQLAPIAG